MKTKILTFGLCSIIALGITTSCTDLLDESYNRVIASQFEPKGDDLNALVGAAYVPWRETMLLWNGVVRAQELPADQDVLPARPNGWVDGGIYKRMHQHKWTTQDEIVLNPWERTYSGINTCNRVLYQIESGEISIPEGKEEIIAELKVLRASYYYILVDLYGNVPIVDKFDVPEGFLPEQSTQKQVYEFIIKEITENINKLSEEAWGNYYGRFNKWAAYTLLAKMYLNAEIWSGTAHWQDCIDACDKVIAANKYELESDQSAVFITKNENSKEIIFALPFDETYVTDWNAFDFHMYTLQPSNQATYNFLNVPWGGVCCTPQYINTFDPDDSRLKKNFIQGQQYTSTGEEIMCTMGSMSGQPLAYINEVPSIDESQEIHGFRWGKFEYAPGSTNRLSNDWPQFRYADILLMKAESLMRLGKENDAAIIVTKVRERNFKDNPSKAIVTGADLLKGSVYDYGLRDTERTTHEGGSDIKYGRFLDELAWEFTQEGRRRQDMIRFGVYTKKSWFSHEPNGDYRSLYPIPHSKILTNSNLTQNPGY
ncbi:RagB/SusD family nutrient uptake outer membrane protein [Dysgonomonas sp. Marseille-P4677]|uniref:RagB/SusD family nutrient uptake outer membrane protein n=1 Tax=Dysgonomonas sp. Marseille-P4677 TaxID=2364790 RepID=UPI001911CDF4|nr:RagB/SusD family nutrient uptake outer membrane protein [Dysgonomonas sp. Marseille-P4677]